MPFKASTITTSKTQNILKFKYQQTRLQRTCLGQTKFFRYNQVSHISQIKQKFKKDNFVFLPAQSTFERRMIIAIKIFIITKLLLSRNYILKHF